MNRSSINWLVNHDGSQGFSWNPIAGCIPVHTGCSHCYAARLASTRLRLVEPLRRRKPSSIFPVAMGDLFHEKVTNEQIAAVFGVMAATPQHRYFVLTKRARRMRKWFEWTGSHPMGSGFGDRKFDNLSICAVCAHERAGVSLPVVSAWPLPNVALLVSVSDQRTADELIPELLQTPAAMRGISLEPMIGEVDLWAFLKGEVRDNSLAELGTESMPGLSWIVVGGESGHSARPCHVDWIRSVVRQCAEADTACFVKQLGSNSRDSNRQIFPLRDRAGAEPSEWPARLRVRQRPVGW